MPRAAAGDRAAAVVAGGSAVQIQVAYGAPPTTPTHANAVLMQAMTKLRQRDPAAGELFASVAQDHDVREAWLGAAVAHHLNNETQLAGQALAHALSRHAVADIPLLSDAIAEQVQAPGWCALDGSGMLTVQLVHRRQAGSHLCAGIDGRLVRLQAKPGRQVSTGQVSTGQGSTGQGFTGRGFSGHGLTGQGFIGRLPGLWRRMHAVSVWVDDVPLLGSPIILTGIVRVQGFANSRDGDLHGWAWCPNDPDHDPVLSIVPLDGSRTMTVVADDRAMHMNMRSALARPRGFHVPADRLRRLDGPVRVLGADGRELTGSPLDPSAERRSAERTAKIVAGLFPSPGRGQAAASQDLAFPSAPAHVIGGPVEGGIRRRRVDVVIPVYGGLDCIVACLQSVLADLPRWVRVVVVDDASPDPCVADALAGLAARRRITLLVQAVNQGFPRTANVGIRHDATRDVVLLNSDTLVASGWLAALRAAAYSAPDIGGATPFSNDATILSYPSVEHPNAMPDLSETIRLDALARKANAGHLVDIPTAVGFCVYIKRDCLNATGLLREDLFAQGYGEENDFCIRARHLGWRHVAVPSVFVAHVGGHSFGAAKDCLTERNMRVLNQLHPGYDALIQDFHSSDPLAEARRRLDMARWETMRTPMRSVLLITHNRSGGVRRHVAERAAALRAQGLRPILLWPADRRDGTDRICVLSDGPEGGTPNMRFAIPAELDLLAGVLKADRPVRAEVHHMIGHDHQLMDLFRRLRIPYEIVVHDYSWLCPRINLIGADKRYCREPGVDDCDACVADAGPMNDETIQPRALRERSAREMARASGVVVASEDVADRIRQHFPLCRPRIVSWEDDSLLSPAELSPVAADGIRRVCVVGAIGIEKGYEILLACARDAANRGLNLRFHLVGHSCDDARLLATGAVQITGQYHEHEVAGLIRQQQAQLAWLPSLWPETWCYTLTLAWQAGLNVLAFNLGTPSGRIRRTGRGWLVPLATSPQALNNRMLTISPAGTRRSVPFGTWKSPVVLRKDYVSLEAVL
jgi:GT2 family glycosyltransferase/glycosyltransferase involved in cell wall biosynthesis